jgi:hypothetical protein
MTYRYSPTTMGRTQKHAPLTSCSVSFQSLVLVTLLVQSFQLASAASFTSVQSGAWSDPVTWGQNDSASRGFPGSGDDVFVASGTTVIVDTRVSTQVNSVNVQPRAILTCPRNAQLGPTPETTEIGLALATLRIEDGGCFSCGFGDCEEDAEPFAGRFLLRLTSDDPPATADDNVRTVMVESGGALFLSGTPRVRPVTRLAAHAEAGQSILRVSDPGIVLAQGTSKDTTAQPWRVGDRVAIAPTDWPSDQTEYGTIIGLGSSGTSTQLTLADPLRYARNGRLLSFVNKADGDRKVIVDARAEIALLSRNVVVEGVNDAVTGLGGDVMMGGPGVRARLSWVEFRYLGRRGQLARYPLHIHNLGDSGRDVKVSNVAIHSSFQRGIVIHCTNSVTLVNNTVAGVPGFAYMLEDGAEEGNTLIGNYAIDVKPSAYPLLQTERVNSAGFWFVNPANTFVGNVAAGVAGAGFSLDMDPVLGNRPATLSTCPERLPGYDAQLAAAPGKQADLNFAINTALIKKEVVRFDDNVVHAAHSGLWMSYPFTPMFFVNRTVPLVRFTAWKIASRQVPLTASSDGISLQFDGCMRLQGQRGMRIVDLTCVDSQSATWASCVNTFEGTTVAWTSDAELKSSGAPAPAPSKLPGIFFTHTEPQVFLMTEVADSRRPDFVETAPLFVSTSAGGALATLNTISGVVISGTGGASSAFASTNSSAQRPPMIQLKAGDMQVFTDESGDAFGAGPGAVVAATFVNASGVDPLIGAYAGGQCTVGVYARDRKWAHVSSSVLPNGRAIAVQGGLPMLCTGSRLRFAALNVGLRSADWASLRLPPVDVDVSWPSPASVSTGRRASAFPILVPVNDDSMHPVYGGYSLRFGPDIEWSALNASSIEVSLSASISPTDGLTLVVAGLPSGSRFIAHQPSIVTDGTSATCPEIASQCRASGRSGKPLSVCICNARDKVGEAVVRFQASATPRNVGLLTNRGKTFGIYDYGSLRIDLG